MPTLPSYLVNFTDPLSGKFIVPAFSTDGSIFPTSPQFDPSAVNINTSILIYGKGSPNYGERIAEDLLHTLENFYGATEPLKPSTGQLWFASIHYRIVPSVGGFTDLYRFNDLTQTWLLVPAGDITVMAGAPIGNPCAPNQCTVDKYWLDTSTNTIYLWSPEFVIWLPRLYVEGAVPVDGVDFPDKQLLICQNKNLAGTQLGAGFTSRWKKIGIIVSAVAPVNPIIGDLWYDTSIPQLNIWSGLAWDSVANRYLLKDGDNVLGNFMTGDLTLFGPPSNPLHATTKAYVDALVAGSGDGRVTSGVLVITGPGPSHQLELTMSVPPSPIVITGFAQAAHVHTASDITFIPVGNIIALDVQAAITELENEKAPKDNPIFTTGVTLVPTTTVLLGRDPIANLEAATKQYVDNGLGVGAFKRIVRRVETSTGLAIYSSVPEYVVEANELWVYINGIKQLQGGRGQQQVLLTTGDSSDSTGLEDAITGVIAGADGFGFFVVSGDQTLIYTATLLIEVLGSVGFSDPITGVVSGPPFTGSFTVATDRTALYIAGIDIDVTGSTGNDGTYTVSVGGSTYSIILDETTIPVDQAVPSAVADGVIGASNNGTYTVSVGGSTYNIILDETTIPVDEDVPSPFVEGNLAADYTATIAVDGGGPQLFTVNGTIAPTYGDIIVNINATLVGAFAMMNVDGILVVSDATGALSSISIVDGVAPYRLFGDTNHFVGINPAVAGFGGSYDEDGTIGMPSTQITFTPAPVAGLTIEFMVFRRD